MISHPLHRTVDEALHKIEVLHSSCKVFRDGECGGISRLPLFLPGEKGRATVCCNPDFLVVREGQIRVIIEVEESNIKPTHICGKFLTSVIASNFIHKMNNDEPLPKSNDTAFIQIVNAGKRKEKSRKLEQLQHIGEALKGVLGKIACGITEYRLYYVHEATEEALEKAGTIEFINWRCSSSRLLHS